MNTPEQWEEQRLRAVKRNEVLADRVALLVEEIRKMVAYGAPPPVLLARAILAELQLRLGRTDP